VAKTPKPKRDKAPQKALPGMSNLRIAELDDICETIGNAREMINAGKAKEVTQRGPAIKALHRHNKKSWTYGNVVISLAVGEETLAVRVMRPAKRTDKE
jgi:hypothetical protein